MKKLLSILFLIIFITGCSFYSDMPNEVPDRNGLDKENNEDNEDENELEKLPEEELLEGMSLEEKVAQLFIVDIATFVNDSNLMEAYPVGGFIFFSPNIIERTQIINLVNSIQQTSKIPYFISVDEEGGRVSRLGNNSEIGITKIPTAASIGSTLDYEYAYNTFSILGKELKILGFNMDFAPVADINTNPNNPVIGDRAFSSDPLIVASMVAQAINALQEQGVASVVKHFPGHGDTLSDTHTETTVVEHGKERLNEVELVPFYKAIQENVAGIMVAHINLPNITTNNIPASLSKEIISDLLRNEMNYNGLVITDALNMKAITQKYNSEEASVQAILSGVDILLMPEDFELAYNGIIDSVKNNIISEERINDSVKRILKAKIKLNIIGNDINGGLIK